MVLAVRQNAQEVAESLEHTITRPCSYGRLARLGLIGIYATERDPWQYHHITRPAFEYSNGVI